MTFADPERATGRASRVKQLFRRAWADATNPKLCIRSPRFDWLIFIGSPIICLGICLFLAQTPLWEVRELPLHEDDAILNAASGFLTASHLFAVFFRSHGNATVFWQWPLRFTLVPVLLFFGLGLLPWFMVIMSVIATFWDVYHSAMQTFGLSRIYDMKAGNPAKVGRMLDSWMNYVLYAGPIAAGLVLMDHVEDFGEFEQLGWAALAAFPQTVEGFAGTLRWLVIGGSLAMVAVYVIGYWRLAKQGYKISTQKVALLASTALTSIIAWGFNPFFIAFVVMNAFHALQYFAIVWIKEKKNLSTRFGLVGKPWGKPALIALFFLPAFGFGLVQEWVNIPSDWLYAFVLSVALLHFWYDGFIWSVRKKQV
ncbi:MAG: hypothetical protein COA47_11240 [Robiginitomaculum sp.]|nr:MAG: hypothetical protein COA47_11240 [Robiginitomaculum sp.]